MSNIDTESTVFETVWPGGYIETFEGYVNIGCAKYVEKDIAKILEQFFNKAGTAMEIGCGGGLWTRKYLLPNFAKVIALDVVQQKFTAESNLVYIQVPSKTFTCEGVPDNSVDFLFSFGVFCHLSHEAQCEYLKNAFRKLKPNGKALVMFANFNRHPYYANASDNALRPYKETNISPTGGAWFYSDLTLAREAAEAAGFVNFKDVIPDFRDTLAYFEKPM